MQKNKNKIFIVSVFSFVAVLLTVGFEYSHAQVARQINISAFISNSKNESLTNGEYEVRFALYRNNRTSVDAYPSNGDASGRVWQETQKIQIRDGVLDAYLGVQNPLPVNLNFSSTDYYLGIRINGDSEFVPRKKMGAVPFAMDSAMLSGATLGADAGNIPQLDVKGKLDIKMLPTGTGANQLVLGNDSRLGGSADASKINSGILGVQFGGTGQKTLTDLIALGANTTGNYVASIANGNGILGGALGSEGASLTLGINLLDANDGAGLTQSNSGLEFAGALGNQLSLLQGCGDGQTLKWDIGTALWVCANDLGVSSAVILVSEGVTPFNGIDTLNFNANDFAINKVGTVANIAFDYANSAITRKNQTETITSAWNFSNAGSVWGGSAIAANRGGTGMTNFSVGDMLYATGASTLSKLTIGTPGQVLVVSGGVPSWASSAPGAAHNLLSTAHADVTPAAVSRGAIITGQGVGPTWSLLGRGTSGQILRSDGTDIGWISLGGDATVTSNGTLTLATVNSNVGTFNNVTVNGKGLVIAASNVSYLTGTKVDSFNTRVGAVTLSSTDVTNALTFTPYNTTNPSGYISASSINTLTNKSGNISMWTNNSGYLTSFTETDPIFSATAASAIAGTDISNWNTAYNNRVVSAAGTAPLILTLSANALSGSISDATTAAKGVASFNSTNFSVSGGTVNTIQNIAATANPTFAGVTLNGALNIKSGTYKTVLQNSGTQSADITYTLPVAAGTGGQVLKTDNSGNLYWATVSGGSGGIGTVTNVVSGNGLIGGPITETGTLSIALLSANGGVAPLTASFSGMQFSGASNNQLSLLQGCANNEVLSWENAAKTWKCSTVSGVGGVTGAGISTQVALWNGTNSLTAGGTLGTAAFTDSTNYAAALGSDDNYVSDAQLIVIGNTSNTNTGDNAANSLYSGLATSKQNTLSGTGFVKVSGTTISYDNSTYVTGTPWTSMGYLTSFTETDPIYIASSAATITATNITNWGTAFGWGDHNGAGYLTSFTETDPIFSATAASTIAGTDISNWNTAYGWGNHASAGYITASSAETLTNKTWNGNVIGVGYGGTGTATEFTAGSLIFAGASGVYGQNNSNLYWDNTSNYFRLGAGAQQFSMGVDATDSNKFKIATGNGISGTNNFSIDTNGIVNIGSFNMGTQEFSADSGIINWIDMPVTSSSANGVVNSYTASLDGNSMLTIYGESDGAGGTQNLAVKMGAKLGLIETGATPAYYSYLQGGDQAADITYTLPTANTNGMLRNTAGVWSWDASSYLSGTVGAANGGTGQSSYAIGDLLYASGASTLSKLPDVAAGNALISGGVGVAPSWGKIGLTTAVSGVLDVANGGTGTTALTQGSLVFAGASGTYSQDNTNLSWDNTNKRLDIGEGVIIVDNAALTVSKVLTNVSGFGFINNELQYNPSAYNGFSGNSAIRNTALISGNNGINEFILSNNYIYSDNIELKNSVTGIRSEIGSDGGTMDYVYAYSAGIYRDSGAVNHAYGFYVDDLTSSGITDSYAVYTDGTTKSYFGGNVGIGDTTPGSLFTVGNGDLFQINASGQVVSGAWQAAAIGIGYGGTGATTAIDGLNNLLPSQATNGGKYLTTDGVGNVTWATVTAGATPGGTTDGTIQFKSGTALAGDSTNFFWDDTANRLGIGTVLPQGALDVRQIADGGDSIYGRRFTDTTPSGNYLRFQNAAGAADIFKLTAAGNLQAINGSASLPTYSFFTDQNTGMYGSGADVLYLATGGSARLTVNGTTDLQSTLPLRVSAGSAAAPSLSFTGDNNTGIYGPGGDILKLATAGIDRLTIDASGKIGIGTATPNTQLELFGTTNSLRLSYDGFNSSTLAVNSLGDLQITTASSVPGGSAVVIGDGSINDAVLIFDGNTQDFYSGLDAIDSAFKIGLGQTVGTTPFLTMLSSGNVGIGAITPTALLHLGGTAGAVSLEINSNEITATNNVFAIRSDVASADDMIFRVQADGAVFADGAYTGTGADYAEYFQTKDKDLAAGETVCVDIQNDNSVKRCTRSGDNDVMGIVSSKPSIVGNSVDGREKDENYKIIAMLGQISAKASNENGAIQIGDSLTSAIIPGYLRKASAGESTVGVALQNSNASKGSIQVLISRRNKSLTVEKVEEAVTARIADMNVQDQVDTMITNAAEQLTKSSQGQLVSFDGRIVTLETITNGFEAKISTQATLMANLQAQMDELRLKTNAELNIAQIDLNTQDIALIKMMLGIGQGENTGDMAIAGKLSAISVEAGKLVVGVDDSKARTIGEDSITAIKADTDNDGKDDNTGSDGKNYFIKTTAVNISSKVFITPKVALEQAVAVTDIKFGEGFTISVKNPVTQDVPCDWIVVDEK